MEGITARNWILLSGEGRDEHYACNGCSKDCRRKSSAHPQRCIKEPEKVETSIRNAK